MRRRTAKHTFLELKDIDYRKKLTPKEYEWLEQFYFEYYQADFNNEFAIHPDKYIKECRDRNNAAKRQIHSVGEELLSAAVLKAEIAQYDSKLSNRYYTPSDHIKVLECEVTEAEDDDE